MEQDLDALLNSVGGSGDISGGFMQSKAALIPHFKRS
jgi:hypothetical protein